jgi:hypothetical protein
MGSFTHAAPSDVDALSVELQAWLRSRSYVTEVSRTEAGIVLRATKAGRAALGRPNVLTIAAQTSNEQTRIVIRSADWTPTARRAAVLWIAAGFFSFGTTLLIPAWTFVEQGRLRSHVRRLLAERFPVPAPDRPAARVARPRPKAPPATRRLTPNYEIVSIRETGRVERPIGTETRTIDNLNSQTPMTRSLKAAQSWTKTYSLDFERSELRTRSGGIELANVLTAREAVEKTVRSHYSVSDSVELSREEEIKVDVDGATQLEVTLEWKRIVQGGTVHIRDRANDEEYDIPYEVDVDVTFDQRQSEERKAT